METLHQLWATLTGMWGWAGKKLIITGVGFLLVSLKGSHPDWPLPGEQFTKDVLLALLAAHSATDIAAIFMTAGKQVVEGKANQ